MGAPAVFLDRDGTLMADAGYVGDPAQVRLLPTVASALRRMADAGFLRVVVSNQSGVARGFFGSAQVELVERELQRQLAMEGAAIDAFYVCPHLDAACDCRKPLPGLLNRAAKELDLDLKRCVMIGDRGSDIAAGQALSLPALLVATGRLRYQGPRPDCILATLADAVDWIMARAR